jgi:hypothetical protein
VYVLVSKITWSVNGQTLSSKNALHQRMALVSLGISTDSGLISAGKVS